MSRTMVKTHKKVMTKTSFELDRFYGGFWMSDNQIAFRRDSSVVQIW